MTRNNNNTQFGKTCRATEQKAELRKQAEEQVRNMEPTSQCAQTPEEIQRVLHELRVHQIELEMQNEELRTAQAEIEAGRARYFDLYDLAPVGYCTLSEQGLIIEANLTAAVLFGTARGKLIKQPISRLILKVDQDIYYFHRKKLFDTGEPQECELRLVKPDGVSFWAHLTETVVPADHDDGPVSRVVISDINAHKLAEVESEKLQARLSQAQKMESVGRLAGGVAHDFNNMLGVILGNVELALDRIGQDDPQREELEEIRKAAQRSADLTRQLLAFARKQIVAPKVLDLNDTVEGMLRLLRQLIGEDVSLGWKPGNGLWPIKMDPAQIDRILNNLCVNARDAISGTGKITVETHNAAFDEEYCSRQADFSPGDYVRLSVSDNGCGMDSETLLVLFEPFYTTRKTGKGTGLGLATVYGIVKQNNGFINICSEPGKGTTFNIYLPKHATGPM